MRRSVSQVRLASGLLISTALLVACGQNVQQQGETPRTPEKKEAAAKPVPPPAPTPAPTVDEARNDAVATGRARNAAEPAPPAPPPPPIEDRERYAETKPNPVRRVADEPVSTFSADVDTASYSVVRRFLNDGRLPPADAVRLEELINYFDYDYATPTDRSRPFEPTVAVYPTPWNADTQILHIGVQGYDLPKGERPAANLVLLLDVSGSMSSPDKLPLLQKSFSMLAKELTARDRVSIVVYAGDAGVVLEPTPGDQTARIVAAINDLSAGGSTAGGEGIRRAYELAEASFIKGGVNRVILATDGDFNVGISDPAQLEDFVARKRESGVTLTVLGFGRGNYNDALMQKLAQSGNGNAAYIDTLNEARKVLVDEMAGTLFPIAGDVKFQVEFNPACVVEYRLIGYETRLLDTADFNNDKVDAGDIGAGHRVTAMYEMTPVGSPAQLTDERRYGPQKEAAACAGEMAFLKMRYKLPGEQASKLIERPVTRTDLLASDEALPADLKFAAAVAGFGQILRGDPYLKSFGYDEAITLGQAGKGADPFGYRAEFLSLVRLAQSAAPLPVAQRPGGGE